MKSLGSLSKTLFGTFWTGQLFFGQTNYEDVVNVSSIQDNIAANAVLSVSFMQAIPVEGPDNYQ